MINHRKFEDMDAMFGHNGLPLSPPIDFESMDSARDALTAWLDLPQSRRLNSIDAGAGALFDAAFGLLESSQAKDSLSYFGAWASIDRDDDVALSLFLSLGARFKPALESHEEHSNYSTTWKSSILHHCAAKRRWRCLTYLSGLPLADQDQALAEALLREPEPNALREVNSELLMKVELERASKSGIDINDDIMKAISASHDFIVALLNNHASNSEDLSLSIAVSELLQGNPFYQALRLVSDDESHHFNGHRCAAPESPKALDALIARGLFNPASPSHREALLSLCESSHPTACRIAFQAGLSPASGSARTEIGFFTQIAQAKSLAKTSPAFQDLCREWTAASDFGQRAFMALSRNAEHEHAALTQGREKDSWKAVHAWHLLANMANGFADPSSGFGTPSITELSERLSSLDHILLASDPATDRDLKLRKALLECAQALSRLTLPSSPTPRL